MGATKNTEWNNKLLLDRQLKQASLLQISTKLVRILGMYILYQAQGCAEWLRDEGYIQR